MPSYEYYEPQPTNGDVTVLNVDFAVGESLRDSTTLDKSHFADGRKIRGKLRRISRILRERPEGMSTDAVQGAVRRIAELAHRVVPPRDGDYSYQPLKWYSAGTDRLDEDLPSAEEASNIQANMRHEQTRQVRLVLAWDRLESRLEEAYSRRNLLDS